jgi:XRE family transcriptional regulator, fatty acid utilization regulator
MQMQFQPEKLRYYRSRAYMTQEELARAAKITVSTISRLENGLQQPRISTVRELASVLGVGVDDLVEWNGLSEGAREKLAAQS